MAVTINASLKRDALLQTAMRAFRNRILPVLPFARRFNDVPLEGTDKIVVPYFPLASGASRDWNASTGYTASEAQSVSKKEVTVNKRKFRTVDFNSTDYNRQPFLSLEPLLALEAEKLADDVLADIWSLVTATNYAGTTLSAMAATAFDLDDVLDMRELCHKDNWPKAGRSLVLDTAFGKSLTKDSRLGLQNAGSAAQVRAGFPDYEVGGFNVFEVPNLPANSAEKVAGAAIYPSAMFVAFSPITPHPTLTKTTVEYQRITDPETGLTLEYRSFGDPVLDKVIDVVECNYGYAVGEAAALKRITTP